MVFPDFPMHSLSVTSNWCRILPAQASRYQSQARDCGWCPILFRSMGGDDGRRFLPDRYLLAGQKARNQVIQTAGLFADSIAGLAATIGHLR